jgi:hypothetical protein
MRALLLSLLTTLSGYQYYKVIDWVDPKESKEIINYSEKLITAEGVSAEFVISNLKESISSAQLITEEDLKNYDIEISPEELHEINTGFFTGMENIFRKYFPKIQEAARKAQEKRKAKESKDL